MAEEKRIGTFSGWGAAPRLGRNKFVVGDLYYWLLTAGTCQFALLLAGFYVGLNALFALAYLACGDGIAEARPGSFVDAFFFSVQTMATIGYGHMVPVGLAANILVTMEAWIGLFGVAVSSGLLFARFTRPTAGIRFSRNVVVHDYEGMPTVMFRLANQRRDLINEARIHLVLLRDELSAEGHEFRRLHDLTLVRSFTPAFGLTWTVMHVITPDSPLHGMKPDELASRHAELLVQFNGHHEGFRQEVHARTSYQAADVVWGRRFADVLTADAAGKRIIDFRLFDDLLPASEKPPVLGLPG